MLPLEKREDNSKLKPKISFIHQNGHKRDLLKWVLRHAEPKSSLTMECIDNDTKELIIITNDKDEILTMVKKQKACNKKVSYRGRMPSIADTHTEMTTHDGDGGL